MRMISFLKIDKNIGSTFKQNAGGRREEISDAVRGFEMLTEKLRSSTYNLDRFYIIESNAPQIGATTETLNKSLSRADYAILEYLPGGTDVFWPATCKVWTPLSID